MDCQRVEESLPLYFYDELGGEPRAEIEAHLAACPRCAATAEEFRRLRAALAERPALEPSPDLLVRCRYDLEEALDRETTGWRALVRSGFGLWPTGSSRQATAALAILLVGFSLGWAMRQQPATPAPGQGNGGSSWMGADLSNLRINGISRVTPDPQTGEVHITLDAERRLTLEGSLDDARIQQVLLYAMKSYENPGIRRDTLEVLRQHGTNPSVRAALLYALRNDPNGGVRLEVLQAVDDLAWSPEVRGVLLEALLKDTNAGVRVAALNALLEHPDEQVLPTLEQLANEDKNPYVRLRCAKAVRELSRGEF